MSSINTDSAALLVVDLQQGILPMLPAEKAQQIIETNNRLAGAFRTAKLPVIWIHATGLPAGTVMNPIPEPEELPQNFATLDERLHADKNDHHIFKQRTWSAFPGTDLEAYLKGQGITDVVLTGIATGAGVDSTARSAYDAGFTVVVVSDAVTDGSSERHRATLEHDVPAYGMITTSADVVESLTRS